MSPDPLDRLEHAVDNLAEWERWHLENRLGLLWVHSGLGICAGILMLLTGTATSFERYIGDWTRPAMGYFGLAAGLILGSGLLRKPRSIPREVIGLSMLMVWDLAMCGGFIAAIVASPLPVEWANPFNGYVEHINPLAPRPYAIVIYLGIAALIAIHLATLRKLRRARRRGN